MRRLPFPILFLGCGGDLSNRIFLEDAEFLAALPDAERMLISYPEADPETVVERSSSLFELTLDTLNSGNIVLTEVWTLAGSVQNLPPSERGEAYRLWGPFVPDENPDIFILVEMSRSVTGSAFDFSFQYSDVSSGPWTELMHGIHYAGEEEVSLGSGEIDWIWMGNIDVSSQGILTYDFRELPSLRMEALVYTGGDSELELNWLYTETATGGGELVYAAEMDVDPLPSEIENTAMIAAWDETGLGRGDATISGGDYGDSAVALIQCWSVAGELLFQSASGEFAEAYGGESACPLVDGVETD